MFQEERTLSARMRGALGKMLPAPLHASALRAHQALKAMLLLARRPSETRFVLPWLLSLRTGKNPLDEEVPWFPFRAIDWLSSCLTPSMKTFEWGSGGSTVFIARRVRRHVAVEHNRAWAERVKARLRHRGIDNCGLQVIGPDVTPAGGDDGEPGPQRRFCCLWSRDENISYEQHVRAIDGYQDEHFDLVSVDGCARLACIRQAMNKVRPGGYIILDNAGPYREEASAILKGWGVTELSGLGPCHPYAWQNLAWRRPVQSRDPWT